MTESVSKSYYYANGRVSVLSLKLLNGERFLRMAECGQLSDALKILYEANYAGGMTVEDPNGFERILEYEWESVLRFAEEASAEKPVTDCFLLAADIHNLKVLMKRKYARSDGGTLLEYGLFGKDAAAVSVLKDDYSFLPGELALALEQIDAEFYAGNRKPAVIDTLIDKAYYKTVLRLSKQSRSGEVKDYFVLEIDGKNILSFFRVKKAGLQKDVFDLVFLEGGSLSKDLFDAAFDAADEKAAEPFRETVWADAVRIAAGELKDGLPFAETELKCLNLKKNVILPHKADVEGILPLINYILAKRTEIENLRLVLVCVKNKTDKNKIIRRLRELYV